MKQWLSIFSAVLVAGAMLLGWQTWVKRWEEEAVKRTAVLIERTADAQVWRLRLPDPTAVNIAGACRDLLEISIPAARVFLVEKPPGAGKESELRAAIEAADRECAALREELAKPGNAFAAKSR